MVSQRWVAAVVVLGAVTACLGELPVSFDLRDVNGQQYVSTRIDDQVGPGPCWAFSTLTAVESNVRINGLWDGAANDLDLSEQFLRANETTGTTWPVDSPGYSRKVNSGGNEWIGVSHMARLHGPLYESQCPFEYKGDFRNSKPYYDPDHYIHTSGGNVYADRAYPLWPQARPYPAEYTSDVKGAYFLTKAYDVSGTDAIKQKVMEVGAPYVRIQHEFNAYDKASNTYYDDGSVEGEGLGAHGVNIIGWDDSKVVPDAPNPGAWLIKHSHEVDENDPLYPDHAGEAPTYFWVSYDTSTSRFTDRGNVTFFEMGSAEHIRSAHFHDYTGNYNNLGVYLPDDADGAGLADASVSAQVFRAGEEGDEIGIVSFYTRKDDQPFELAIYDSLADLQTGAHPLSELTGIADVEGYHTVELEETVPVAANDDFVVVLDFTDGEDQLLAYTRDGTGVTGSVEMIQEDWCYYYDTTDGQWEDLFDSWSGVSFTTKAYGVPEPSTLSLLAVAAFGMFRRRRR
jgi:C1A family cysteine protease